MTNGKSKLKYQGLSLREAALVSRYGPIAKSKLAVAALTLWPCERRLKQAETTFNEILSDLKRLSEIEAFAKKRLYRFTAGLDPTWVRDRARVMDKIHALKPDLLAAATRTWKGLTIAMTMYHHAVTRYNKECVLAGRQARHGLAELRRRYESDKVYDPMTLRLIELTKATALRDRMTPEMDDHGPFLVMLRPWAPERYRLPWKIGIMPLLSFEFQRRFTAKEIVKLTGKRESLKLAKAYNKKATDLGWELRPPPEPGTVRHCKCEKEIEKHKKMCENCARRKEERRKMLPIDVTWPSGRSQEPSWHAEDRQRAFWDGREPEHYAEDEYTARDKGIINQTTRDVSFVKEAHRDAVEAFGANEWRRIKFSIDHSRMTGPMHQDLWNSGKGQDQDDPDDYENQQNETNKWDE